MERRILTEDLLEWLGTAIDCEDDPDQKLGLQRVRDRLASQRAALIVARAVCQATTQFNWGASCLDAAAIRTLNEGPGIIEMALGSQDISLRLSDLDWKPLDQAPKDQYLLLRGDSGYNGTPYRYIVAKHDASFRPLQPWVDYAGDSVLDGGEMPTEWVEL